MIFLVKKFKKKSLVFFSTIKIFKHSLVYIVLSRIKLARGKKKTFTKIILVRQTDRQADEKDERMFQESV